MPYSQTLFTQSLTVPSTASTTTAGAAFAVPIHYNSMLVVGSFVGLTGGTLDIYIQDSFDDGTTWIDCAHFTQVSAAASVTQAFGLALSGTPLTVGKGTVGAPGVVLAAGSSRSAPWGPKLRLVAVSGGGTSGASQVQSVMFLPTVLQS